MVGIHSRGADLGINSIIYPFIYACRGNLKNFEIGAVSKLASMLIEFNLWSKFLAIYPFVGGNSISHSINLKNVKEYKIDWYGNLNFNRSGVSTNGIGYGLTNIPLVRLLKINDTHISAYNRTPFSQISGTGRFIGVNTLELIDDVIDIGALELNFNKNSGIVGYVYNKINTLGGHGFTSKEMIDNNIAGTGLMVGMNSFDCYLNNQRFGNRFPLLPTEIHPRSPRRLSIFGDRYESNISSSINANISFASVGSAFSKKELELFNFSVETFQQLMSRSVM